MKAQSSANSLARLTIPGQRETADPRQQRVYDSIADRQPGQSDTDGETQRAL